MKLHSAARFLLKLHFVRVAVGFLSRLPGELSPPGLHIKHYFQTFLDRWQQLSHFRRHFILNLSIGLVIAVALHIGHDNSLIRETENIVMDAMISVNQRLPRMTGAYLGKPLQFTYIDIDENTYRAWNEPFFIPRDKLLRLIRFATDGGARVVVVDVDFSTPSNTDEKLLDFLKTYDKQSGPPLVLIRSFYPPSKYTQDRHNEIRPSIIDTIRIDKQVFQAFPLFWRSDYDRTVRHWYLWNAGCLNGKPKVLPSIQLVVDILLIHNDAPHDSLTKITQLAPDDCRTLDVTRKESVSFLKYGEKHIELSMDRIGERIIYTLPGNVLETVDLVKFSARDISESKFHPSVDSVRDRVVVIGSSFADSRDIYMTPIGEMPGALIVLNAIKSLHLFGQINPPSAIVKWIIELVLIVLMAWAYARLDSTWGTLLVGTVILITLVPISFYFFKYGVWVDLALPLLGMQFHQLVAQKEEDLALQKKVREQSTGDQK